MKKILALLIFSAVSLVSAGTFTVNPENAVIAVDPKANAVARLAASELQYYVEMMTGKKIPIAAKAVAGKYVFLFEKPAGVQLKPEEAVWQTDEKMTRFYGDSTEISPKAKAYFIFRWSARSGDLTAVYDFLEQQLGFRFLAPGKLGTAYTPSKTLTLKTGRNSWDPGQLVKRGLRPDSINVKAAANNMAYPEFYRQKAAVTGNQKNLDTLRWLKQMRMGSSVR